MIKTTDLNTSARIALQECLNLKPGEKFLVVTDEHLRKIGYSFFEMGREIGAESIIVEMIPRQISGEEPPLPIAEMWKHVDVFVCPTSKSLTHTSARRNAVSLGARGATLPGVTEEMMMRCIPVNYTEMKKRVDTLVDVMTKGNNVHITTPAGTDLKLSLGGRQGLHDTGLYREKGESGNLPAGEAFIAPMEGTANGILIVDGAMIGVVKDPIKIVFKDGYAVEITGGKEAEELNKLVNQVGKEARNCAEFGVGVNEAAIVTGNVLEDEKIFGTIHIAIGSNFAFGGKVNVPFHMDGIVFKPTVNIDGNIIIKDGQHLLRS
jgi:leucyl aminopeptidase (aminopeptidase T)